MNQKKAKKLRQYVRKQVNENFGEGMQTLSTFVRSRPRWIPKWIWIIFYMPLIQKKYIHLIYKHMD